LQSPEQVADQDIQFNRAAQVEAAQVEMQPQLVVQVVPVEHKVQVVQVEQVAAPMPEHNYLVEMQQGKTDQVEAVVGMVAAQVVMMEVVGEVAPVM
jgi:hypothetical protein